MASTINLTARRTAFAYACAWPLAAVAVWLVCSVASAADPAPAASDDEFAKIVRPFLQRHCLACHGADKQQAERRFDQLDGAIRDDNSVTDYQDMLDQLNLGAMPPKETPQPTTAARRAVVQWLETRIARYHQHRRGSAGETVLRRLNAREYRATVRDLLRIDTAMFDPTVGFPRDQTSEHLDNDGQSLVMSGHLLAKYLQAAQQIVDKALYPLQRPAAQKWVFRDGFRQQPEIDQVHRRTNEFQHLTLYDVAGADKQEGAYAPIHAFSQGVPHDGYYTIRFQAAALNREHPYDPKFLGMDPSEPLRLGIVAGFESAGPLYKPQPLQPLLAELDLADETRWYTVRVWMDRGCSPRFTFRNGLMDVRNLWGRLVRKYPEQFPKLTDGGIVEVRFNAIKYGKLPQIQIYEVEIEGPHYDQWPKPSQLAMLGDDWQPAEDESQAWSESQFRERLQQFMSRAYRRPTTSEEVERMMQLARARQAVLHSSDPASQDQTPQGDVQLSLATYADTIKAVLCSPHFLYLDESARDATAAPSESGENGGPALLNDYALASRLSYFLWSSQPDAELLEAAARGDLQAPEKLAAQVRRLLADPRGEAMLQGFLDSWLVLRELGASPPDRRSFNAFYQYDLGPAMRRESHLFAQNLLQSNGSIHAFLDSDYAIVNKRLARHYGIEWPEGQLDGQPEQNENSPSQLTHNWDQFQRLAVRDPRRGGLLGQASVLTVTANGIDTSPVIRGVWLLENLLGTPPSPPPPDVEPLDPDVRGAKTIRDQLRKHRDVASCNDCHRKIDPLGFALENFDPVGGWRDRYPQIKGPAGAIDASGELPDGGAFRDVQGLKKILLERPETFDRNLATKLLEYGLGRQALPADRPHIDATLRELERRGHGLRDLIELTVLSQPFRRP